MAFQTLIQTQSFEHLTVNDIAQQAHVNRSTFYRYYHSKYDVLRDAMPEVIERAFAGPWLTNEAMLTSILEWANANRPMVRNLVGELNSMNSYHDIIHIAASLIQQKITSDEPQPPLVQNLALTNHPTLAIENFAVSLIQLVAQWSRHYELQAADLPTYVQDALQLFHN
jgi:AcrR family transcriptional regulator